MSRAVRRLTPFEASFALPWHRKEENVLPMNCYVAVRLCLDDRFVARFEQETIRAVQKVQERHPLLRMTIGREQNRDKNSLGFLALFETEEPIDVEFRPSPLDTATLEKASAECLAWKDTRQGTPLCRVLVLRSGNEAVIFFAMSHAIFDGRSTQIIAQEFLALLNGSDAALPDIDEETEHMSFRDIMNAENIRPVDGFKDHAMRVMSARPEDARLTGYHALIENQQETGSLLVSLSQSETEMLAHLSRKAGVSLNSYACAAWVRTIASDPRFNVRADGTQFLLFVADARRSLPPKYSHTLAQIMGPGFATVDLKQTLVGQCTHIDRTVRETVANNWHFLPTTRNFTEADDPIRWATAPIKDLSSTFPKANAALSNLGRIDFETASIFIVERVWLAGGLYPDGNLVCQAASTNGVCTFTIQYVVPAHSKDDAGRLADRFVSELGIRR